MKVLNNIYFYSRINGRKKTMIFPYDFVKQKVIENGFLGEIQWCNHIPNPVEKSTFYREYAWVVINSGMKNKIASEIFKRFANPNGKGLNFDAIKHPNKNKAIKEVFNRLDYYYNGYLNSNDKLEFLESLPHIGKITKYHLARNLGLDYAKPDRHLVQIAFLFDTTPQKLCEEISREHEEKIGTVDLVLWRFATLYPDYLSLIKEKAEM